MKYKIYNDPFNLEEFVVREYHKYVSFQQVVERELARALRNIDEETLQNSQFVGDIQFSINKTVARFTVNENCGVLIVKEGSPVWNKSLDYIHNKVTFII